MNAAHIVVIGAGSTGCAVAHDLALRGFAVTVVERAGVASGTTGHNGGQFHSGARYAVTDPVSARECSEENQILRRIMPGSIETNGGLFVALRDEHMAYLPRFLEGCAAAGIAAEQLSPETARRIEPLLSPRVIAAVKIPDGTFDPYRFCLRFLASALANGARVQTFTEVISIDTRAGRVSVRSRRTGQVEVLPADAVINAAGPWAGAVARLGGVDVRLEASAGVLVTLAQRLSSRLINLLCPPGDGQVIVPQRGTTLLGTTSWQVPGPDDIPVPPEHVRRLIGATAEMLPAVSSTPVRGVMASARPLIPSGGGDGRKATRQFAIYDHSTGGCERFFSIIGGKTTTTRRMAEDLCDQVCLSLGVQAECRTAVTPLLPYRLGAVQ